MKIDPIIFTLECLFANMCAMSRHHIYNNFVLVSQRNDSIRNKTIIISFIHSVRSNFISQMTKVSMDIVDI